MNEEESRKYLQMLGQKLQKKHITGEILIIDEIVILLDIRKPAIHRDFKTYLAGDDTGIKIPSGINYYFRGHGSAMHRAIVHIAVRESLPETWIYEALEELFHSQSGPHGNWIEYPGVRAYIPLPEYALAIKVATAHSPQDLEDIRSLAKKLHISTPREMISSVTKYISKQLLTPAMKLAIRKSLPA